MSRDTKTIIAVVLFVAILLVAVGFAAISNIPLNIRGTAQAEGAQENFTVKFTGTPTSTKTPEDSSIVASGSVTSDLLAAITATGFKTKGEKATVTYTVQNASKDLSANVSVKNVTGANTFFSITAVIDGVAEGQAKTLAPTETATVTVTIELLKTPSTETAEALTANIGVELDAAPVQM